MATRRQEIVQLLSAGPWSFDELRRELGLSVATLRSDLEHVAKSLRRGPRCLRVSAARCRACGFEAVPRGGRFTTPGRCPRCRAERLEPPTLSLG